MTTKPWDDAWFADGVAWLEMLVWRGVEAQHVVSTTRLVDNVEEQELLERVLEASKPALPKTRAPQHYLLTTPFRYRSHHASRFRAAGALGLWYGAETRFAACAEVAYWRWRFLTDSDSFPNTELLTVHTLFQAQAGGEAIDLMRAPWSSARDAWTQPSDYQATQAIAQEAAHRNIQWIGYESVRAPGARCAAVLDVNALSMVPGSSPQTWHCKTSSRSVMFLHGDERYFWTF